MSKQTRLDTFPCKLTPTVLSGGRKYTIEKDLDKSLYSINHSDPFFLDVIKIKESEALARLPGKMQVISTPLNNHISNRRSHTDRVVAIALQLAYLFGLNIDLCLAAALGHDVGHCPYGPHGGDILGIKHPLNGVIILQEVEGLNLTKEVIRAILYHSLDANSLNNDAKLSNEAYVVALADKFAYLFCDFEDFERAGMLKGLNLPEELRLFGYGNGNDFSRKGVEVCVNALIEESLRKGYISFSDSEIALAFQKIRKWAYDNVYKRLNDMPDRAYHKTNLAIVKEFFVNEGLHGNLDVEFAISMMTDYDINWLAKILREGSLTRVTRERINNLSVIEIIKSLNGRRIDHTKYLLDW